MKPTRSQRFRGFVFARHSDAPMTLEEKDVLTARLEELVADDGRYVFTEHLPAMEGEDGRPHAQGALHFSNPQSMARIKKALPDFQIKSNAGRDALGKYTRYLLHDGVYEDFMVANFDWRAAVAALPKPAAPRLTALKTKLVNGEITPDEVRRQWPVLYLNHERLIERAGEIFERNECDRRRERQAAWDQAEVVRAVADPPELDLVDWVAVCLRITGNRAERVAGVRREAGWTHPQELRKWYSRKYSGDVDDALVGFIQRRSNVLATIQRMKDEGRMAEVEQYAREHGWGHRLDTLGSALVVTADAPTEPESDSESLPEPEPAPTDVEPVSADLVDLVAVEIGVCGNRAERESGVLAVVGSLDMDELRDFWREDSGGGNADDALSKLVNDLTTAMVESRAAADRGDESAVREWSSKWDPWPDLLRLGHTAA